MTSVSEEHRRKCSANELAALETFMDSLRALSESASDCCKVMYREGENLVEAPANAGHIALWYE